jgi:hypothetical protein
MQNTLENVHASLLNSQFHDRDFNLINVPTFKEYVDVKQAIGVEVAIYSHSDFRFHAFQTYSAIFCCHFRLLD